MDKVSIQSLYKFKQNYRDRIEVETADWRKEMREEGLDPDIIFEDLVEFLVNRLDEKTTTQDRKDVWPVEYITEEGIYPAVMAEWIDTMIAVVSKHAKDISPDFRREMLELKEFVLTGDLGEDMRNHPDIFQRVLDELPESKRNKPYKLV